jgi:thiamine monophosphate synthase
VTRKQKLRVAETVLRELFDLGVTGLAARAELTDAEWKAAAERLVDDLDKVDASST